MHGWHTFFLYLMLLSLVTCALPTLLTSLPIVCTRDCTPSCETCPRYFSCFRFKVYFQFLQTLPRYPWNPPSALCLLQTEPSFLYSNCYIFVRQVVIKKVGYRVIPPTLAFRNLLSIHQASGAHRYTYELPQNQPQYSHAQGSMVFGDAPVIQRQATLSKPQRISSSTGPF